MGSHKKSNLFNTPYLEDLHQCIVNECCKIIQEMLQNVQQRFQQNV